jgi:hypothetical protein
MSFSFLYSKIAETKMARSMLSHNTLVIAVGIGVAIMGILCEAQFIE